MNFFLISPVLEAKTFLSLKFFLSLSLPVTSLLRKWAIYNKTTTLNLEHTFFYQKLLSIDFLCFRLPVGNLRKINQNQKTSWDCNSCSTHLIYIKQKENVNLNLPLPLWLKILLIDDKECCLFLSHFFVTAADYQFWKVPAAPRTWSVRAKSLFIVFWNVSIILTKWVIILEFGKRLFWLALKTLLVLHVAVMTTSRHILLIFGDLKNLIIVVDISAKFIVINCLIIIESLKCLKTA